MKESSSTSSASPVVVAGQAPGTPAAGPGSAQRKPAFDGPKKELNTGLEIASVDFGEKQPRRILKAKAGRKEYLPGQPRILLNNCHHGADGGEDPLLEYLRDAHKTEQLDDLLPYMRYIFVQTPSYKHIMPLHHQAAHARKVIVDESPGLHLVWYYEIIFIKPVPAYFYSLAFWEFIRHADDDTYRASLGFMRSYYWLIQYELDFEEACRLRLIPKKGNGELPSYEEWCAFIDEFRKVEDSQVNRRYHYGELRLSRINRTATLFKGKLAYFHIYPQWGSFLAHILAPIITLFAVCSVVLNSMQVGLAAIQQNAQGPLPDGAWPKFVAAALWFPVVVMLIIAVVLVVLLFCMAAMGLRDVCRGNHVRQVRKHDPKAGTRSHGMVW